MGFLQDITVLESELLLHWKEKKTTKKASSEPCKGTCMHCIQIPRRLMPVPTKNKYRCSAKTKPANYLLILKQEWFLIMLLDMFIFFNSLCLTAFLSARDLIRTQSRKQWDYVQTLFPSAEIHCYSICSEKDDLSSVLFLPWDEVGVLVSKGIGKNRKVHGFVLSTSPVR